MSWTGSATYSGVCCIILGLVFRRMAGTGTRHELRRVPSVGFRTGKGLASEDNWRQMHQAMVAVMTRPAWAIWLSGALTLAVTHLTSAVPAAAFLALVASAVIMQRKVTTIDAGRPPRQLGPASPSHCGPVRAGTGVR